MSDDTLKVLVVEPQKAPRAVEIPNRLDALQGIVGGHLEAVYPFPEHVAVVCNESGKIQELPFNRPLLDKNGRPYDVICGTFFVAGVGTEDFVPLTDDQIKKFSALYDNMIVLSAEKEPSQVHQGKKSTKKKGVFHER